MLLSVLTHSDIFPSRYVQSEILNVEMWSFKMNQPEMLD